MSVSVTIEFSGTALGERPSRDFCEHLLARINEELATVGGALGDGYETKREDRRFLGQEAFWVVERSVRVGGGFHINDDPPADPPSP